MWLLYIIFPFIFFAFDLSNSTWMTRWWSCAERRKNTECIECKILWKIIINHLRFAFKLVSYVCVFMRKRVSFQKSLDQFQRIRSLSRKTFPLKIYFHPFSLTLVFFIRSTSFAFHSLLSVCVYCCFFFLPSCSFCRTSLFQVTIQIKCAYIAKAWCLCSICVFGE